MKRFRSKEPQSRTSAGSYALWGQLTEGFPASFLWTLGLPTVRGKRPTPGAFTKGFPNKHCLLISLGKGAKLPTFVYVTCSPGPQWGDFFNIGQSKVLWIIGQLPLDGSNTDKIQANWQGIKRKSEEEGMYGMVTTVNKAELYMWQLLRE